VAATGKAKANTWQHKGLWLQERAAYRGFEIQIYAQIDTDASLALDVEREKGVKCHWVAWSGNGTLDSGESYYKQSIAQARADVKAAIDRVRGV
jgi:hypothetical protein